MNLPLQLIVFSVIALIYLAVRKWRGDAWGLIFQKLGWQWGRPIHYLYALGVLAVVGVLGRLAFGSIPAEIFEDPNVNVNAYAGLTLSLGAFLTILLNEALTVALGEEVFFRGLLGGWLMRKTGFWVGNTIQAAIFLLPHLLLLTVSLRLWPILLVQALTGWLLGWLRYRSDSILPGWAVHSLVNALGALAMLG